MTKPSGESCSDKLPRRIRTTRRIRCQHLEHMGFRCKKRATWEVFVFENPEHIDAWYVVNLCDTHAANTDGDVWERVNKKGTNHDG